MTLARLWLDSFLVVFVLGWIWNHGYHESIISEFSLQSHRYVLQLCSLVWHPERWSSEALLSIYYLWDLSFLIQFITIMCGFDKKFVQHCSQEEIGRERYGASGQSLENGRKCRSRATAERYSTSCGGSRVMPDAKTVWGEEFWFKGLNRHLPRESNVNLQFWIFLYEWCDVLHSTNTLFCMSLLYDWCPWL